MYARNAAAASFKPVEDLRFNIYNLLLFFGFTQLYKLIKDVKIVDLFISAFVCEKNEGHVFRDPWTPRKCPGKLLFV